MKLKLIFFIVIILTVSSCYTVLKHPEVPNKDLMGNIYHQNISSNENCYKCHTEDNQEVQDYSKYSNYYNSETEDQQEPTINRWDSYYSVPWWFTPQRVTVSGSGGTMTGGSMNNSTQKTSAPEGTRTVGSTRTDVKIDIAPPTVSQPANSNNTNNESSKTEENKQTNQRSSNNNNDDKRNSGSTRGK